MTAPCDQLTRIVQLEEKDKTLQDTMTRIEVKLDMVVLQISKIAVLEEKHSTHAATIDRIFARMSTLEKSCESSLKDLAREHTSLKENTEKFINHTNGLAKGAFLLWTLMGTGLGFLLLKGVT